MPVTNHTITCFVNGINRTSSLRKDAIYVKLSQDNKSDVGEFRFKNFEPNDQDVIQVYVNGSVIFGGVVISKSATVLGVKPYTVEWTVEAKDWSVILDRVTVNETYTARTDKTIIQSLASNYLNDFNADTYVQTLDNDLDISFIGISLRDAFDNLANAVGAKWYIDSSKNIRWFSPSNPTSAAFSIDTYSPNNSTSFDILRNSLKYTIDSSSIINRVIVNGGTKADGTKVTESFAGDGSKKSFGATSQIIDSAWSVQYTDVNNLSYTTYGSFIGYAPGDKLVSEGGGYTVIVGADRKSIYVEGNNGAAVKNGTNVIFEYYYKEGISFTIDHLPSQGKYGNIYSQSILNKEFDNEEQARQIANAILNANAYAQESIQFDITRFGLIPGTYISVKIPEVGIGNLADTKFLTREDGDRLLLEDNNGGFLLQSDAVAQTYLIQEVQYTSVVTRTNEFMIVAKVTLGSKLANIVNDISKAQAFKTNAGAKIQEGSTTRLSNISSNLGEVAVGRANFTDGGTARFRWGQPNGATGVVVGLEDRDANAYGAFYVYDSGETKVKLGRLNDLPPLNGVTPSGWGIYTQNGYFSGVVTASSFIGGTIATSQPPINTGNPGLIMTADGLEAYGNLGLTFRLSSNPAIKPYFSSGTIENVVYEVTTASVIRTGTSNARVQIDNSGIFAWNNSNILKFSVDAATGKLTAVDGSFSGTVSASEISGGTITGGTITGAFISGGTISSGLFTGANGSVNLSDNGLVLTPASAYGANNPSNIRWVSGTVPLGNVVFAGGILDIRAGYPNAGWGHTQITSFSGTTSAHSLQYHQRMASDNNHYHDFKVNNSSKLAIFRNALFLYETIYASPTNTIDLGAADAAFKHLYLSDGTDEWRISINSSGVLTTTKV